MKKEILNIKTEEIFNANENLVYKRPTMSVVDPEEFVVPAIVAGIAGAVGAALGAHLANKIMM